MSAPVATARTRSTSPPWQRWSPHPPVFPSPSTATAPHRVPAGALTCSRRRACRLTCSPDRAARMLRETNFTFMYAARYHPAMKNVGPIRRELGVRTIFNILGPLTNPASASVQIVGVARPELLEPLARVLVELGVRRGAVVYGENGIDEVAGDVPTSVYAFNGAGGERWTLDPADYGIATRFRPSSGGASTKRATHSSQYSAANLAAFRRRRAQCRTRATDRRRGADDGSRARACALDSCLGRRTTHLRACEGASHRWLRTYCADLRGKGGASQDGDGTRAV